MSNDAVPKDFFYDSLMYPSRQIAPGKFGKGPREGGFTRYFVEVDPATKVPQPTVIPQAFYQGPRGGNVHTALARKALAILTRLASGRPSFCGTLWMKLSG